MSAAGNSLIANSSTEEYNTSVQNLINTEETNMKYCNVLVAGSTHLAAWADGKLIDLAPVTMEDVLAGAKPELKGNVIENPVYANLVRPDKLLCVGLNYRAHAQNVDMKTADCPILFSKFANALVPTGTDVCLPPWETSYDYEAELVIVMGKTCWNVAEEDALDYVFGFTAGNDFSCRDPQKRTSQWLIGKTMPGFGPCGPCIVTKDEFDISRGHSIKSYVNGELRQNGSTEDMIFSCAQIISFASRYVQLEPGDLIFTGTPSGVELEKKEKHWLKPGDVVDIDIEGIGRLTNRMV